MTYATQADMTSRFDEKEIVELSDRANVGVLNVAVLADKLADADAEINAYLQGRYTLPLATVPTALVRIACDIARYHLYDNRATEAVTQRYKDAIAFLKGVAKGDIQLGVDSGNQVQPISSAPEFDAPERLFTRDTLADY